jgi:peptide/nickel transport system permease protein
MPVAGLARFVVRRILLAVPVFIGVTAVTFVLMQLVPGDPVALLMEEKMAAVDPAAAQRFRARWGLDAPAPVRYLKFLANAARGDLGISYRTDQDVLPSILERAPATAALAGAALAIAIVIGVPLGVAAAIHQNTALDSASIVVATVGVSIPNFWLGILLIYGLAVRLQWLPPSGYGPAVPYLLMPAFTLGAGLAAVVARLTRSSMLEVIRQDYVRTGRAKGLSERRVVLVHALRNAAIPIVTIIGVQMSGLLSGAVITERVFSWPGAGRLLVDSIGVRDLPMTQGCVLFIASVFILLNLLVDLSYAWLDPRIRYA